MNDKKLRRAKSFVASIVSFFLVASTPGMAAAANVVSAAASAKASVGIRPVPLHVGASVGGASMANFSNLSLTGTPSVLPGLSAVPGALPSGVNAAVALPAGNVSVQAPVASRVFAGTAVTPARSKDVAGRMRDLSKGVNADIQAVGSLESASASTAHGMGSRLMQLLTGALQQKNSIGDGDFQPNAYENQSLAKKKMIQTLEYVASIFSEHYAPLEWKNEKFNVVLKEELAKAKAKINSSRFITTQQFQSILAEFTSKVKDHHVGIAFYSTEQAKLPIDIAGAGGKHFITNIDRSVLPKHAFPFKVGDRVIEFGGRPVEEVVAQIQRSEGGKSRLTDIAMAEMRLTRRTRQGGDTVPQGAIQLKILTRTGQLKTANLQWQYQAEMIPEDIPVRDGGNLIEGADPFREDSPGGIESMPRRDSAAGPFAAVRNLIRKFLPMAFSPIARIFAKVFAPGSDNPFAIGGKKSFVPDLGEKVWEAPAGLPFYAYIFKASDGKKVGFVRISDYMQEEMAAEMFGMLMVKFQAETDSLVIDQVNNPGGDLFYMYALLSRLTDKPLDVPLQRMMTGEAEAMQAAQIVAMDPMVTSDMAAMQVLGSSLGGYAVTLKVWKQFVGYFKFILAQLEAGKRFTDAFAMMGIDKIEPHPTQRYTKPITLLINELDFSCADFFPAILQDNGRVRIFGRNTAGAGGAVRSLEFPNQFGIAMLAYTFTIAIRKNGDPIENLGVKPDIKYAITEADIREGFTGYKDALNKVVARQNALSAKNGTAVAEKTPEEKPATLAGKSAEGTPAVEDVEAPKKAPPADVHPDPVTVEELKGTSFSSIEGVPGPGLPQATLTIGKDGAWKIESQTLWNGEGRSGKDFNVADRMEAWGDQPGQLALFGDHGGPIIKLTADKKAQLKEATGQDIDYLMVFVYGSLADGEMVMLFGRK